MDEPGTTVEVEEPGFEGRVIIGDGTVRVTGTRPQDGANVVKEVPVDRDAELAGLVDRVTSGDGGAPRQLLAHLGVLDPPLPD